MGTVRILIWIDLQDDARHSFSASKRLTWADTTTHFDGDVHGRLAEFEREPIRFARRRRSQGGSAAARQHGRPSALNRY
jgi:hypothetical protein